VNKLRWPIAMSFTLAIVSNAWGVVVKNISTGIDDVSMAKIANNLPDTDFTIIPGSNSHVDEHPIARSAPLPPPYFADASSAASRWLAFDTGDGEEGLNVIQGTYYFETFVDLTGFQASTAQITGLRYGADDQLHYVYINGIIEWVRPDTGGGDFFDWHTIGSLGLVHCHIQELVLVV
jgi:hypothetical protein